MLILMGVAQGKKYQVELPLYNKNITFLNKWIILVKSF